MRDREREKKKTLEAKPENKNDKVHILVAEKPQREKENQSSFPPYLISWPFAQQAHGSRTVLLSCSAVASQATSKLYIVLLMFCWTSKPCQTHTLAKQSTETEQTGPRNSCRASHYLHALIKRSRLNEQTIASRDSCESLSEIHSSSLDFMLAHCSYALKQRRKKRIHLIMVKAGCLLWLILSCL